MAQSSGRGNTPSRPKASRRTYPQRVRNYAKKLGKTPSRLTRAEMRAARGHKDEPAEKKRRRSATWDRFGVSPETLTKLRREARQHMLRELDRVGTTKMPEPAMINRHLGAIKGEGLAIILGQTGDEIRRVAALRYDMLVLEYPEFENDDEINPDWY